METISQEDSCGKGTGWPFLLPLPGSRPNFCIPCIALVRPPSPSTQCLSLATEPLLAAALRPHVTDVLIMRILQAAPAMSYS